jgi:uncharacterized Tic20 family protein
VECQSCGHLNNVGANYCEACGSPVSAAAIVPATLPAATGGQSAPATIGRPDQQSRLWAIAAHVSALVGGFLGGVPAFLGPLVVWLLRRDVDPFATEHSRDALNFNLSVLIYYAALILITIVTFGLSVPLTLALGGLVWLGWLLFSVLGAVRAASDQPYHYPLTIRFVR